MRFFRRRASWWFCPSVWLHCPAQGLTDCATETPRSLVGGEQRKQSSCDKVVFFLVTLTCARDAAWSPAVRDVEQALRADPKVLTCFPVLHAYKKSWIDFLCWLVLFLPCWKLCVSLWSYCTMSPHTCPPACVGSESRSWRRDSFRDRQHPAQVKIIVGSRQTYMFMSRGSSVTAVHPDPIIFWFVLSSSNYNWFHSFVFVPFFLDLYVVAVSDGDESVK